MSKETLTNNLDIASDDAYENNEHGLFKHMTAHHYLLHELETDSYASEVL